MSDLDLIRQYNYDKFEAAKFSRWLNFENSPTLGQQEPDFSHWEIEDHLETSLNGIPVYKSDWTDSHSVANTVEYLLTVNKRRKSRERVAPFRVQRLDFCNHDREAFVTGLERQWY